MALVGPDVERHAEHVERVAARAGSDRVAHVEYVVTGLLRHAVPRNDNQSNYPRL